MAAAVTGSALAATAGPALAQTSDTTAPVAGTPTIATVGPAQYVMPSGNPPTVHPSTTTGPNNWYNDKTGVKVALTATDDTGVAKFQVKVGSGAFVDVPATGGTTATGTYTDTTDGRNTLTVQAVDAAGNVSATKTLSVSLDYTPPVVSSYPGLSAANTIGDGTAPVTPKFADTVGPGGSGTTSGGTAIRDSWLDGKFVFPLPLDPSKLSLGKHTWALQLADQAGNNQVATLTFVVTTSVADLQALVTKYAAAGSIDAADAATLQSSLTAAATAKTNGDALGQVAALQQFSGQVGSLVAAGDAQSRLLGDAADALNQARGVAAPTYSGLGLAYTAADTTPLHLYQPPAPESDNVSNPDFRVLVYVNQGARLGTDAAGYRHESIEDVEVMLQKLGHEHNFAVDIWDYAHPEASVASDPFASLANLQQYKAIIGDSSVGNQAVPGGADQANFQAYMEAGGGFVAIHAGDDSLHNNTWYKDLMGGLFANHPSNQGGFLPNCSTCLLTTVTTEDPTNPSTVGLPKTMVVGDELYHFDRKPRPYVHVLQTLDESSYVGQIGVNTSNGLENGDHPISWCDNYDGGHLFAQVLGHNWQLMTDPWYVNNIYHGILQVAGYEQANCITYRQVTSDLQALQTSGDITAAASTNGQTAVTNGYSSYMTLTNAGYKGALDSIDALTAIGQDATSGSAVGRAKVLADAAQLRQWMLVLLGSQQAIGSVGGTVPATLSLTLGAPVSFGTFAPGVANTYSASTTAAVISSADDAALTVVDPDTAAPGHLVNGTFSLPQSLQAKASSAVGAGGAFAAVSGSPLPLLTYSGPVSNDAVTLSFQQQIGANDALRTGAYGKSLTYTLSTTTP